MHEIKTIQQLKEASAKDVEMTIKNLGVVHDLHRYLNWVGETLTPTKGNFKIGPDERKLGVHPSTVSHKGVCPVKVYYECTGDIEPSGANVKPVDRITFDLGSMVHIMLQTHFKNIYDDQFKYEVKLKDKDLHMTSSADGIFEFSNTRAVIEIKSIKEGGSYGFDKVQTKPFTDHIRQATCYMRMADIPFAIILYFCKNNSQLLEHAIQYDESIWNEIEQEVKPIVEAAYNKGPMVQPKAGSNCYSCQFAHGCPHSERKHESEKTRGELRVRPSNWNKKLSVQQ
jgi:CRISPR/Cas system-associated exonuclease Cas4 (RecB family)